jgi:hypothetical protein
MKIGASSYSFDVFTTYTISALFTSVIAVIFYAGFAFWALVVTVVACIVLAKHLSQNYISLVGQELVIKRQFRKVVCIHVRYYKGIQKNHLIVPFQNSLILCVKGGEFKFSGGTTSAVAWDEKVKQYISEFEKVEPLHRNG